MKKFTIFGFKFLFEVKKKDNSDEEKYSDTYFLKEKVFYLILALFLITISAKIPILFRNNNYMIGDVVKSDIYSPKTIVFRDKIGKDKIIQDMINQLDKEYIYSSDAADIYTNEFDNFHKEIIAIKKGNLQTFDYSGFERKMGKAMPETLVKKILEEDEDKINSTFEKLSEHLKNAYTAGIYKEKNSIRVNEPVKSEIDNLDAFERDLINYFLIPNYIYDEAKTKSAINEKVSQINDQYIEIKAGTLIAKTGEILTERKIDILDKLGIYNYKMSIFIITLNIIFLLVISSIFNVVTTRFYSKDVLEKKKYKAVMLLMIVTLLVFRIVPDSMIYLVPIDTMLLLLMFIVRPRFSIFLTMMLISYLLPITDYDLKYFTIQSIAILATGFLSKNIGTRSSVIAIGIQLAILKILLYLILSFFSMEESFGVALNTIKLFVSGLFSGMFAIALLPYFERTFNILTVFRLIELADLSQPLLRKLSIEAPGTFQHSMMVATLSENAVIEIGGDPIFTRVACYYHDIGKTKRPQYYVENQTDGKNLHNNISPFMSKMIILAHTKEGAEMGKKYKIPKEIRDIMFEHQGTTLLAYFYNKAKEIDPNVQEEEFRYSGPRPQTKESAVILLADSIEAAVRSLDVKDPIKVEEMVRRIVNAKIADNQLSDANITFKEIEIIINSFLKTFGAIYHERIKYPGQK
ncbi:HD family phosphohydrolase [Fusobacterium periodonticum]|uniref:Metal dependent phosphohydrolase n=1 Tax=Fusobacterium periodonticum 1_1_41FAA TaxID=469621 RepID=D6LEH0_9FUSO|nr:HD family phosphohydrolase [Fusobacterium periodonticum]EFG28555.1 7TM-HD extracellular [Fusobacterium periodonticum 1_1_41FAA]